MEYSYETVNGHALVSNGHGHRDIAHTPNQSSPKASLKWLDLRVFYVRISKCESSDSIPEFLTLNHVPLHRNTLLEVNGHRASMYSDGISSLLRRDRLDKKSEEATFVCTDSIRMTGSLRFQVFDKDVLVLSGALELCNSNDFLEGLKNNDKEWKINCDYDSVTGSGFLKGNEYLGLESASPAVEVYVAGCFSGTPIILTKTLQLGSRNKQTRKGMLDAIPENEATGSQNGIASSLHFQETEYASQKLENVEYKYPYRGSDYIEGEGDDGELSWFSAGVRVGVGIGLSICLGVGIGVGLLVRTYRGTTSNFRRRLP